MTDTGAEDISHSITARSEFVGKDVLGKGHRNRSHFSKDS